MAGPLRILLAASSLDDDGGAPVAIGDLATALADLGHSVEIIGQYAHELASGIQDAQRRGTVMVTGFHQPWTVRGQYAAAREAGRLVQKRARQALAAGEQLVVHTHGVWVLPVIVAGKAARAAGVRHVITPHGMLRQEAMRKSGWKKRVALAAAVRHDVATSRVHVTSDSEAADLRLIAPRATPVVIPLGIRAPTLSGQVRPTRARRTAGFLGRVIPIKNLDTLLRAWRDSSPADWLLRIAGPADDNYRILLERLSADLGLADRVRIEPQVPHDRIGDLLSEIDLFILPSRSESFGMSVGEALAASVPVIVTTAAPWRGVTNHGCGWWVEPTRHSLAQAITEATSLGDTQLKAMGSRGAEWTRRDFSWVNIARQFVDKLYYGLAKRPKQPGACSTYEGR